MSELSLLDLERCPFIGRRHGATAVHGPAPGLGCGASGEVEHVSLVEQRERCFSAAHASCSALLAALSSQTDAWLDSGKAARVVAESCHLAEARLEVQAEQLEYGLAALFGRGR